MARVMICDDDRELANQLIEALRAGGHEATTCNHAMDVLREAANGRFDLIAFGLDMAGFGGTSAVDAINELAPHVALIGLHNSLIKITHANALARLDAIIVRPVSIVTFMSAVAHALEARAVRAATAAATLPSASSARQSF